MAVGGLMLAAGLTLGFRLFLTSVTQRTEWISAAERQQQRTVRLPPERGSFVDRDGRQLATSVRGWSAFADPSVFATDADREQAAARLATVIDLDREEILRRLSLPRYFAWLERKLPAERRDAVQAQAVPGVGFVRESRRVYPRRELAAHLLGGVGVDGNGLAGLEHVHDRDVAGRSGLLLTRRDARGGGYLPGGLFHQPPTRGADVVLTVDAVVQHVAERELEKAVARFGATAGTVIVMVPDTGEVLALTNHPTYDPNNHPTHPSHLRTNRAVASCYEPGSTFKIFTVAAALEEGAVHAGTVVDCLEGSVRIGRTRIRDHQPFGRLTVSEVLEKSSNVGAIQVARTVGSERLHERLRAFGFGRRTGVGLPGESAGILRDVDDWTPLSLASVAFGQEVAVSAVQLATATAVVANGGVLMPPRIVRMIRRGEGEMTVPRSRAPQRVLTEDSARLLSSMLEGVVERGTGRAARVPGHRVAGKTGTAQKIGPDGTYEDGRYVASFVGWVPARDPAILALVVIDEPTGPTSGGEVAAPVFAAVARDVLRYLKVPSELPGRRLLAQAGGAG